MQNKLSTMEVLNNLEMRHYRHPPYMTHLNILRPDCLRKPKTDPIVFTCEHI